MVPDLLLNINVPSFQIRSDAGHLLTTINPSLEHGAKVFRENNEKKILEIYLKFCNPQKNI